MGHSTIVTILVVVAIIWLFSRYFIGAGAGTPGAPVVRNYFAPRPAYDGVWGIIVVVLILWLLGII